MDDVDVAIKFGNGAVSVTLTVPEADVIALESCLTDEVLDQIITQLEALRG